jgi:hypothetical protein
MTLAAFAVFTFSAAENITWITVPKPVFDLTGVILYSLGLAALCAFIALGLGIVLGAIFIARSRRHPVDSWSDRSFQLLEGRRP